MNPKNIQPVYIMADETQRTTGKNAQKANILVAKEVANTVKSTLGPKGMDKMIVTPIGDITVTNDGVTILREMQIEHPTAKMIIEVAKTQEEVVGDGTTTVVILAGELLDKAEKLIEKGIHPTTITNGFRLAEQKSQEILNKIAGDININDDLLLKEVAMTAMIGKGAEGNKEFLSNIIVNAVKKIAEEKAKININNIKIIVKSGEPIQKTELIDGVVIDKERCHNGMPEIINNAKVALISFPLEISKGKLADSQLHITNTSILNQLMEEEERIIREKINKIKESGADVVFCQESIDDEFSSVLSQEGIMAVKRVKKDDIEKISKATKARILTNINMFEEKNLGKAGIVTEKQIGKERMIFVEQCENPKAVTILVRAGTEHIGEEIKRTFMDALGDLASSLNEGKIVAGAGSTEMQLSVKLNEYSEKIEGKEHYAVKAFAEALESIPYTLSENSGLESIEILTKLRNTHKRGKFQSGIDVFNGKIINAWEKGIKEPLKIKTQAISSATEVAEMILRIDDIIVGKLNKPQQDIQKDMPFGY